MSFAIETEQLAKRFGKTTALDGIDLRIRKGSVFGLLGPNGAGKTTTIRILATLQQPTEGRASVLGHDVVAAPHEVRRRISLTGQYAAVDEDLTGRENLILIGRLLGLPRGDAKARADELLGTFELAEAAARQVRTYSGGMRRRIDIAASLVSTPEVLFLDEPTTGLDPRSRNQVWDMVRAIAAGGTTVLLTTQYLEEADRLADRLAVIDHGRIIAEGTSRELKASVGANAIHVRLVERESSATAARLVAEALGIEAVAQPEPGVVVTHLKDPSQTSAVVDALTRGGVQIQELTVGNPSLDDVFFALTGRPAASTEEVKA